MSASAIVQCMLEDDEVGQFMDRHDDLGWNYWLNCSHGFGWGRVDGMGPYVSLEEACAAAKEANLFEKYPHLSVSRVPKHRPDLTDRAKKFAYLKQLRGWDLNRRYEPTPDGISRLYDQTGEYDPETVRKQEEWIRRHRNR